MFRTSAFAAAVAALAAFSGPAAAQGWSFSYGIGDPYSDPYYRPAYPVYPAPPVYRTRPPVVVVPAPGRRSVVVISPGEVEDDLRANGFTRLSPIEARGETYRLTANDPRGNVVDLAVSMRTGQIASVRVIEPRRGRAVALPSRPARRAAPARPAPAVAAAPRERPRAAASAPAARAPAERAQPRPQPRVPAATLPPASAPAGEPDPLVVY